MPSLLSYRHKRPGQPVVVMAYYLQLGKVYLVVSFSRRLDVPVVLILYAQAQNTRVFRHVMNVPYTFRLCSVWSYDIYTNPRFSFRIPQASLRKFFVPCPAARRYFPPVS